VAAGELLERAFFIHSMINQTGKRLFWIVLCLLATLVPAGAMTVKWEAATNVSPGGWGRLLALNDGSWLCVCTQFARGTNTWLQILRSTDRCRTWTPIAKIAEAGRQFDNGELVQLTNGVVLLSGRSLVEGKSYRLPVYQSLDAGKTWAYLSNIDSSEGLGQHGLWEPDFQILSDGRLAVAYSNEKHQDFSQVISEKISNDNGTTWSEEIIAVAEPSGGKLRPGMPQMARMANGKYIMVYEIVNLGNGDVHQKISDDGIHWPAGLGTPISGQHCGPFVTALPDGFTLVTSCQNELTASADSGTTWQAVTPPPWKLGFKYTWPAIYPIGSNEFAVMIANRHMVKLRFAKMPPRHP
jgi:BNR repeat-like domain